MADVKPIRLMLDGAKSSPPEDGLTLHARAAALAAACEGDAEAGQSAKELVEAARLMDRLDAEYGADAALPVDDAPDLLESALTSSAWLDRRLAAIAPGRQASLLALQVGMGYWGMRHGVPIRVPAPLVNALARQANEAATRQDVAAVFAMMQGLIAHLAPELKADLERSNPERPWRLLTLNYAITAIRAGDAALMRHAFDTLNDNLPDERAGFYADALALAAHPAFPPEHRALIEAEAARWTLRH